jgi:hypothetical protein
MSDTPKFEVIDRRKLKKQEEEEQGSSSQPAVSTPEPAPAAPEPAATGSGPRLVVNESTPNAAPAEAAQNSVESQPAPGMPPAPTAQ